MSGGRASKAKGSTAEREVITLITPWWRQLEPSAEFVRTPGSGGWRHAPDFKAKGDIMASPATKLFPFFVEVKRRENFGDAALLRGADGPSGKARSPVFDWWRKCVEQAEAEQLCPMLWFRRSREAWRIMVPVAELPVIRWVRNPFSWVRPIDRTQPALLSVEQVIGITPATWIARSVVIR